MPWKLQLDPNDLARSNWLRALAAYSLQFAIGDYTTIAPAADQGFTALIILPTTVLRGRRLHQFMCSTELKLHRGPSKLQPVAI